MTCQNCQKTVNADTVTIPYPSKSWTSAGSLTPYIPYLSESRSVEPTIFKNWDFSFISFHCVSQIVSNSITREMLTNHRKIRYYITIRYYLRNTFLQYFLFSFGSIFSISFRFVVRNRAEAIRLTTRRLLCVSNAAICKLVMEFVRVSEYPSSIFVIDPIDWNDTPMGNRRNVRRSETNNWKSETNESEINVHITGTATNETINFFAEKILCRSTKIFKMYHRSPIL